MKNSFDFYKGKKVFVTGHTGFKGSWLSKILVMAGADVYGYSLAPTGDLYHVSNVDDRIHFCIGDIRDFEKLRSFLMRQNLRLSFIWQLSPL